MFERLSLLWRRFSPVEERLLAAVRDVLPDDARPPFDAQVSAINLIQRHPPSWTEICYFRKKRFKVDWSGVPVFRCADEFRLAQIRFRADGRRFKSTLTCIDGHIFDFSTTPGLKTVAFSSWESDPHTELLANPLGATTGKKAPEIVPPVWENFLAKDQAALVPDWTLHDGATAYRIVMDKGEFLVLAERDGEEFILHLVGGEQQDELYYLPGHDGVPEVLDRDVALILQRGA